MQSFALSMYSKYGLFKLFEGCNSNFCYLLENIFCFYFGGKAVLRIYFSPAFFSVYSGTLFCLDLFPILIHLWFPFVWSVLLGSSPLSFHPSLLFFVLRKIIFRDSTKEPLCPLTSSWMSVETPVWIWRREEDAWLWSPPCEVGIAWPHLSQGQ